MMNWEVTEDGRWLKLVEYDDELDLRQVEVSFTRKVKDAHFLKKQAKYKGWDGTVPFLLKRRFLAIGLWMELLALNEKFHLGITIHGLDTVIDMNIRFNEFKEWVQEKYKDGIGGDPEKMPRDYQIEAAFKIIKFRISSQELATNAGKTFITYLVVSYLMEHDMGKKFLMIVPTTNLVIQGVEDFQEYGAYKDKMVFQQIHAESKKMNSDANTVLGTYQSLVKKDGEWLSQFDMIFVDEAHSSPAISIKKIIAQCTGSVYRFGLSGTLTSAGIESADFFTIQMCLGPMVGKVTPEFLIENDYATPVEIKVVRMKYLPDETIMRLHKLRKNKLDMTGSEVYQIERKLVIQSRLRLNFIVDFIIRSQKNSLVLFQSVEEAYGKAIYDRIRELTNDIECFYVDGLTKDDLRDEYKTRLKTGERKILVASFGTFSTGISVNNIHNIYLVESYKSENIIKQSIGRGMRKQLLKERVNIIDFVDDFTYKGQNNYLMSHSDERIKIYEREAFPYTIYNIDLTTL